MKIGVLSMQRVINSGSFLQAYALKNILASFGHEVVFVDFDLEDAGRFNKAIALPLKRRLANKLPNIYHLLMLFKSMLSGKGLLKIRTHRLIRRHRKNFLNLYYGDLGLTKHPFICPQLDLLVIGSDEVFNCVQYIQSGKGCPWQLFGRGQKALRIGSYAASFGYTTLDDLYKYQIAQEIGRLLSSFDFLSVRDENSRKIVERLTGKQAPILPDPVMLYDFDKEKINEPGIEGYVLVYAYNFRIHDPAEIRAIRGYAKKSGKQIVCVNELQYWCDKNIIVSPLDLPAWFQHAVAIITDTFHGTLLSIKYQKNFAVFLRDSNRDKLASLLDRYHLTNRIVVNPDNLNAIMDEAIHYEPIREWIDHQKQTAMNYIVEHIISKKESRYG